MSKRYFLGLDRDDTLMADAVFPNDPDKVKLIPGAADSVLSLTKIGFVPAIISNQSGIARGIITQAQADAVHEEFARQFQEATGLSLQGYYCPHMPDGGCACRKPGVELLQRAAKDLDLIDAHGVMIGDKPTDAEAGTNAGYVGIQYRNNWPEIVEQCRGLVEEWNRE